MFHLKGHLFHPTNVYVNSDVIFIWYIISNTI